MLFVAKANRKALASVKIVYKDWSNRFLRSTQFAAVVNHSELVWVRKRDLCISDLWETAIKQ